MHRIVQNCTILLASSSSKTLLKVQVHQKQRTDYFGFEIKMVVRMACCVVKYDMQYQDG